MISAGITIAVAGLWISTTSAQTASSIGGGIPSGVGVTVGVPNGKVVIGRPFSATEVRRTTQMLVDGTRIDASEADKYYRDHEGRIRIERKDGSVMIQDPAQGAPDQIGANGAVLHSLPARYDGGPPPTVTEHGGIAQLAPPADVHEEDLGYQSINGLNARGSRTTTIIPAGQIGNDRPIEIVSEQWYSDDLQMNIKTVNSDPRQGETTWQLTDIHQGPQNATLFQHPHPHSVPAEK
jgi:hypothetical protein